MNNSILTFTKTHHFLLRQWDRSIENEMLYGVLPHVDCNPFTKNVFLVLPSYLKRKGWSKGKKRCLVLISKGNLLLTSFWCDEPNTQINQEESCNYQLLY